MRVQRILLLLLTRAGIWCIVAIRRVVVVGHHRVFPEGKWAKALLDLLLLLHAAQCGFVVAHGNLVQLAVTATISIFLQLSCPCNF